MLFKGLSRAGICDLDHQRRIHAALVRLRRSRPEEVTREVEYRALSSQQEAAVSRQKKQLELYE